MIDRLNKLKEGIENPSETEIMIYHYESSMPVCIEGEDCIVYDKETNAVIIE